MNYANVHECTFGAGVTFAKRIRNKHTVHRTCIMVHTDRLCKDGMQLRISY